MFGDKSILFSDVLRNLLIKVCNDLKMGLILNTFSIISYALISMNVFAFPQSIILNSASCNTRN